MLMMMMSMTLILILMLTYQWTAVGETGQNGGHVAQRVVKASRKDTGDATVRIHSSQVANVSAVTLIDDRVD